MDSAQRVAQRRALVATAQSISGVTHAARISSIPFWNSSSTSLFVPGVTSVRRLGQFTYQVTTSAFFVFASLWAHNVGTS